MVDLLQLHTHSHAHACTHTVNYTYTLLLSWRETADSLLYSQAWRSGLLCFLTWPICLWIHAVLMLYTGLLLHTAAACFLRPPLWSSPLCLVFSSLPACVHIYLLSFSILLSFFSSFCLVSPSSHPSHPSPPPPPPSLVGFPFDTLCVFISVFLSHCHRSVSPPLLSPPSSLHTAATPFPHPVVITFTRIDNSVTGRTAAWLQE